MGVINVPSAGNDVNCDGETDIADVSTLIDYLLGYDPQPINLSAADIDSDGEVSIADVSALIDLLLNQ